MKITKTVSNSNKLEAAIRDIQNKQLKVGYNESAKYPDGTFVAVVAAQNEFGNPAKKIPPRPFFRPTIENRQQAWSQQMASGAKAILNGTKDAMSVLDAIGLGVAGDVRKSISKVSAPSLKESTVKARLRGKKQGKAVSLTIAKPLVDTGYMLNSLTSEVTSK